jgi:hypothetical protein
LSVLTNQEAMIEQEIGNIDSLHKELVLLFVGGFQGVVEIGSLCLQDILLRGILQLPHFMAHALEISLRALLLTNFYLSIIHI